MVRSRKLTSSIKLAILPYNFGGCHWVLIVVEVRRKEILCLDSIPLMTEETLYKLVKDHLYPFLKKVYTEVAAWKVKFVKCPRQTNWVDCGVLMCRNIKEIAKKGGVEGEVSYDWAEEIAMRERRHMLVDLYYGQIDYVQKTAMQKGNKQAVDLFGLNLSSIANSTSSELVPNGSLEGEGLNEDAKINCA